MILTFYSFATWALQPFILRKLLRRAEAEPLYGEHIEERFGRYPHSGKPRENGLPDSGSEPENSPLIWIHAVSLGETRAAAILVKTLRLTIPNLRLLLTSGTATGRAEGALLLRAGDMQVWQPWDTRDATRSFFEYFKPKLGVLVETEIWPNWIDSAQAAQVPVFLVNARMSEQSLKLSEYWNIQYLAKQAYQSLAGVYAQTQDDAARLTQLGATVDAVVGNLKFDITPSSTQVASGSVVRCANAKPIILFASSREGEEALLLASLQALPKAQLEAAQWLIVPRHPQRFYEVSGLIEAAGFEVSCRNTWREGTIWLGDSIGEMVFYYSLASAALLGGSFAKLGGQNLIEALACGCPVVMGPHTFNFEEAASMAAASCVAFQVEDVASAIQCALQQGGFERHKATQFVAAHRGAATRTVDALASFI